MFVTFGILTTNKTESVNEIIDSIESNEIPLDKYEVIVVGNININRQNTVVIHNDDCEFKNWITKKKNLVIQNSKALDNDLVIIAKDYIKYDSEWYKGLPAKFDIIMNQIRNTQGKRYLDWIWDNPITGNGRNIDYCITNHPKMFVPGCFTAAKKKVFNKYKFKERIIGLGKQSDI